MRRNLREHYNTTVLSWKGHGQQIKWGVSLFALAWAVRSLVLRYGHYGFFGWDEGFYLKGAGGVLGLSFSENYFMPGWFYILSFAMRVFDNPRVFVTLVSATTVPVIYLIGEKVFDRPTGIVAGLLLAFFPEDVFFAHYVQAEAMLTLIIAAGTLLLLPFASLGNQKRALAAGLFFGAGILYKHFVVIPFMATVVLMALRYRICARSLLVMCGAFAIPLLAYTGYFVAQGNDPFFLLNSPLKSFDEWGHNHVTARINPDNRTNVFRNQAEKLMSGYFFTAAKNNFANLWTPDSYPIARMLKGYYHWGISTLCVVDISVGYYALLLLAGVVGLFTGPPSDFRAYAALNLGILTSMSAVLFMVSRYRLPFMPFLVLYAAAIFTHPESIRDFRFRDHPVRAGAGLLVLFLIAAVFWIRLPGLYSTPVRG